MFGTYFGLIQQSKSFGGMVNFNQPRKQVLLKTIFRMLVTGVLIIPFLLMYFLLTPKQISNLYALMLLKELLPLTIVGYLLFGIVDKVCSKFNLYDKALLNFGDLTLVDDDVGQQIYT